MSILLSLTVLAQFNSCGFPPVARPIPPIGTDSCEPVCICDEDRNCEWQFICR